MDAFGQATRGRKLICVRPGVIPGHGPDRAGWGDAVAVAGGAPPARMRQAETRPFRLRDLKLAYFEVMGESDLNLGLVVAAATVLTLGGAHHEAAAWDEAPTALAT